MGTESEIRRELAGERAQLADSVADLRDELGKVADRGRRVGVALGAAGGTLAALRLALRLRRR